MKYFSYMNERDRPEGEELTPANPPIPIFQMTSGWYFFDETWTGAYGPFSSREEASKKLASYADWLENGPAEQHNAESKESE